LNQHKPAYETGALPLSYTVIIWCWLDGIEPLSSDLHSDAMTTLAQPAIVMEEGEGFEPP
jgi:hypothetical protein